MDHQEKHNSMVSLAAFGYSDFSPNSHPMIHCFDSSQQIINSSVSDSFVPPVEQMAYPWLQNRMMVDESSLRYLFPVEQQPADEPLSLSLCNPESSNGQFDQSHADTRLFTAGDLYHQPFQLKSSRYLVPAQQLLSEFCSLGGMNNTRSSKQRKSMLGRDEGGSSSSSLWSQSIHSLDLLELQKRKARLLSMLEEVDRRYKKYCEQMRCVVSGFEAAAGAGTASVYSVLASKAMSRHFRSLRDGIVGQIKLTNKAMGDKDSTAPGASRGETPRLRVLDQCLRQQRAFQQAGMMENQPWRPQRGLPERSVTVLRAWLFEHFLHPYPSDVDKHILARQTGLSRSQVSNWFINARVRLWKPMVEEMYVEETKEQDNISSDATVLHNDSSSRQSQLQSNQNSNPNPSALKLQAEDQKPAPGQLLINDSDSLSSIINSRHRQPIARQENFGVMELDFSSYNESGSNQNFGTGVSLTLGLQQHDGGGVNLSFSPASQNSMFLSRESLDDSQAVQFEIIGGEGSNLPYRNLRGAQLLHDLAG